jgi:hypothetical protein
VFRPGPSPFWCAGPRALEVTAPPLLGEHNDELRKGWTPRKAAGASAQEAKA